MKRHRCENPGCKFRYDITISNVSKEIVSKGYKCEYIAYFIKCPKCGYRKEVSVLDLPLKVAWKLRKR